MAQSPRREAASAASRSCSIPRRSNGSLEPNTHEAQLAIWEEIREQSSRPLPEALTTRLLDVTQSNSSFVVETSTEQIIVKTFTRIEPGHNPDVELPALLESFGAVPQRGALRHDGCDLAVTQHYFPRAHDAWSLRSSLTTDDAQALGTLTRRIHEGLRLIPTNVSDSDTIRSNVVQRWERRINGSGYERLRGIFDATMAATWPRPQRIHGDWHLGQALRADGKWWAIDFEGEPMEPLEARIRPGYAIQDVAGMLRSFNYAGLGADFRNAFLDAYDPVDPYLLAAFELDKALYELAYERTHRPEMEAIPRQYLAGLLGGLCALRP